MAANSAEGSFRPNAAYAALIVSNADMVLPPDDGLRLRLTRVILAQPFTVLEDTASMAAPDLKSGSSCQRFERNAYAQSRRNSTGGKQSPRRTVAGARSGIRAAFFDTHFSRLGVRDDLRNGLMTAA
jgi:hypothetical protein